MTRPALRWFAPVAVAAVVAGSATFAHVAAAEVGAGSLPDITAEQLVAKVAGAIGTPVSGIVTESADLGLPDLTGIGSAGGLSGAGSSSLLGLASGSNTARVWFDGPSRQRVALLSTLGETDLIHNGTELWTWNSSDNSVSHQTLPAGHEADSTGGVGDGSPLPQALTNPAAAAQMALKLIGGTTTIGVDTTKVADHAAYELVLTPKGTGSLISDIRIAVDGSTYVPLRVVVDSARTGAAALTIGFEKVSFAPIDPAQFAFTPPPGATITSHDAALGHGIPTGLPSLAGARVVGSGWTSVLVARPGSSAASGTSSGLPGAIGAPKTGATRTAPGGASGEWGALLRSLPRISGSWGSGRVLAGTLFTVVIADDGTIAAGAATEGVVTAALAH